MNLDIKTIPYEPGECFTQSFELLVNNSHIEDLELVHGVCIGSPNSEIAGVKFAHAWLEFKYHRVPFVIDHMRQESPILQQFYYQAGSVRDCRRYPRRLAIQLALSAGHSGPWHRLPRGTAINER